jgi:hypothetical protein
VVLRGRCCEGTAGLVGECVSVDRLISRRQAGYPGGRDGWCTGWMQARRAPWYLSMERSMARLCRRSPSPAPFGTRDTSWKPRAEPAERARVRLRLLFHMSCRICPTRFALSFQRTSRIEPHEDVLPESPTQARKYGHLRMRSTSLVVSSTPLRFLFDYKLPAKKRKSGEYCRLHHSSANHATLTGYFLRI